jgi:hypothetical protein
MAKQTTAPAAPANAYAEKYAQVAANLSRCDAIEARLLAIDVEERDLRGAIPKDEAAARLVEVLRAMRARLEATPAKTAHLVGEGPVKIVPRLREPSDVFELILLLLGDELEAGARRLVARLEYESGAPTAEREACRSALAAERDALTSEHFDLVTALAGAGVDRAHLFVNAERVAAGVRAEREEVKRRENFAEARRRLDAAQPPEIAVTEVNGRFETTSGRR